MLTVGVPVMVPLSNTRPVGKAGLIAQVTALPPLSVGDNIDIVEPLVRTRLDVEYEKTV
tara:strand:+ start:589 stop:765 length:177 start_codon:yes stop_codon:yes gene_type:complete